MVDRPAAVVEALGVEEGSSTLRLCRGSLRLRRFQEQLFGEAAAALGGGGPRLVLLEAPTGAGKTLTLLAPLVAGGLGSLGVYPSRELARDQMESLASLLERMGCPRVDGDPRGVHVAYEVEAESTLLRRRWSGRLHLARVTSDTLEEAASKLGYGSRGEALDAVAEAVTRGRLLGEPAIIFTVPEYPYLLLEAAYREFDDAGAYLASMLELLRRRGAAGLLGEAGRRGGLVARSEALRYLERYTAIVAPVTFIDEFHAYRGGLEEPLAAMAAAVMSEHRRRGLVVAASATPHGGAAEALRRAAGLLGARVVEVHASACRVGGPGCSMVRRETLIEPLAARPRAGGAVGYALAQYEAAERAAEALRRAAQLLTSRCGEPWRRAMILLDRVALVYRAAERVVEEGLAEPGEVACVTSLRGGYRSGYCGAESPREARVIVGNEAVSYGIDIPEVDAAVVYSRDPMQALQRIGRVGRGPHPRGCPAVVHLVLPGYALGAWSPGRLDYPRLAGLLEALLPGLPAPLQGALLPHYALRAAVFLAVYAAVRGKASGMLGTSDETLNKALETIAAAAGEKLRGLLGLYTSRYAVGGAALYRALSLRGGLTARLCSGDTGFEADLLTAARNLDLDLDPGQGCLKAGSPRAYSYLAIRVSKPEKLEHLHGTVMPLGLLAEALGATSLLQTPPRAPPKPLGSVASALDAGALDPAQPLLVHAKADSDTIEAAAALGLAVAVLDPRDNLLAALLPL